MLSESALLIVSNPTLIGNTLSSVEKHVNKTLYIQLLSALRDSAGSGFFQDTFTSWPKYSQLVRFIYCEAARYCHNLDVRVLLSGLKSHKLHIKTHRSIDLVIFDKMYAQDEIDRFVKSSIRNIATDHGTLLLDAGILRSVTCNNIQNEAVCDHSVLGGTFDRLHIAHKLLLSEAALRAKSKVTVGVTEENMLKSKILWELIEDTPIRMKNVEDFLNDICPELDVSIFRISDPLGSAVRDPSIELIVVSTETVKGAEKINEIRQTRGLSKLVIVPLDLVDEPFRQSVEEAKISSSTSRIRLLGAYLKLPVPNDNIASKPRVIGLTGGIASGKSSVAKILSKLGAFVVDCDIVAHKCYEPGKSCYNMLIEHFGNCILSNSGEINRKMLGEIVFKNPVELEKLNSIVWPAIAEAVRKTIDNSSHEIVVIEAAVLLPAGWDTFCHEIWTTIIPHEEAINRLKLRNGLTEEQAALRLDSQPSNTVYVKAANIVFCTLWDPAFTEQQVEKAWNSLLKNTKIIKLKT